MCEITLVMIRKVTGKSKNGRKTEKKHRPLAIEVGVGTEGGFLFCCTLYCLVNGPGIGLRNGFSATEVRSQRLMVAKEPSEPRGRIAHLRVRYATPVQMVSSSHGIEGEGGNFDDKYHDNDNQLLEHMFQIVHLPLAEGIVCCLRLTPSQGPFDGVHPSTLKREEKLRQHTGIFEIVLCYTAVQCKRSMASCRRNYIRGWHFIKTPFINFSAQCLVKKYSLL